MGDAPASSSSQLSASPSTMDDTVSLRSLLGVEDHRRSTDDVLAATLPLLRQVADLHDNGLVAPLAGVEEIRALRGRLFFPQALSRKPELAPVRLLQIERDEAGALHVVARLRAVESEG